MKRIDGDTTDNLVKMAIHIVKKAKEDRLKKGLQNMFEEEGIDFEAANIEQRVSNVRAHELHAEWKALLLKEKAAGRDISALFGSGGYGINSQLIDAE